MLPTQPEPDTLMQRENMANSIFALEPRILLDADFAAAASDTVEQIAEQQTRQAFAHQSGHPTEHAPVQHGDVTMSGLPAAINRYGSIGSDSLLLHTVTFTKSDSEEFTIVFRADGGVFSGLQDQNSAQFTRWNEDKIATLTGTASQINHYLRTHSIQYSHNSQSPDNELATISVAIAFDSELGSDATAPDLENGEHELAKMEIAYADPAPTVSGLPAVIDLPAGSTNISLPQAVFADRNDTYLTARFTVDKGQFAEHSASNGVSLSLADNNQTLVLQGRITDINQYLSSTALLYKPSSDPNVTMTVSASDQSATHTLGTVAIRVPQDPPTTPTPDPMIHVPSPTGTGFGQLTASSSPLDFWWRSSSGSDDSFGSGQLSPLREVGIRAAEVLNLEPWSIEYEEQSQSIAFQVDAGLDVHSEVTGIVVTQADGKPLPSWLRFDATTGLITETPPAEGDLPEVIEVKAVISLAGGEGVVRVFVVNPLNGSIVA